MALLPDVTPVFTEFLSQIENEEVGNWVNISRIHAIEGWEIDCQIEE